MRDYREQWRVYHVYVCKKKKMTKEQIARHLNVSVKTVERDFRYIQMNRKCLWILVLKWR